MCLKGFCSILSFLAFLVLCGLVSSESSDLCFLFILLEDGVGEYGVGEDGGWEDEECEVGEVVDGDVCLEGYCLSVLALFGLCGLVSGESSGVCFLFITLDDGVGEDGGGADEECEVGEVVDGHVGLEVEDGQGVVDDSNRFLT